MANERHIVEVAVFAPLRQTFHYLSASPIDQTGVRVRVPFGRSERIGIVVGLDADKVRATIKLKTISELIDQQALISDHHLALVRWAASYYEHPIGDAFSTILPGPLRKGSRVVIAAQQRWSVARDINEDLKSLAAKAPRQAQVLQRIAAAPCGPEELRTFDFDWRRPLHALRDKGLVTTLAGDTRELSPSPCSAPLILSDAQQEAVSTVAREFASFRVYSLYGVTGSGKTEVYISLIRMALQRQLAAMVLVPEIILTEQLVLRLRAAFGPAVAMLHSHMSDRERAQVWLRCQRGDVDILMGTRSAVWAPLDRLGLIIVDEEHDASFKQQDGFRYHARDVAVMRARAQGIPIILGSATPSLESQLNVKRKKYTGLYLLERAGSASLPRPYCVDVRGRQLNGGLSQQLSNAISERIARQEQSLLFLNRRGFAPLMLCHSCGWVATCTRCDARLVWHRDRQVLRCHHCGQQKRLAGIAPCCDHVALVPIGVGTEQIELALRELFPDSRIARVDRDSMRRKTAATETMAKIRAGEIDILIGTQMLAKGHDFPRVSLVGIVDADAQLFSTDFRAEERLAQLLTQVAGRAGRAAIAGEVIIQTHHPHHPLLTSLLHGDYLDFAERALHERERAELPPFVHMALIRAEAPDAAKPLHFLGILADRLRSAEQTAVDVLGPVSAVMEKRAGRYRAQLAIMARKRRELTTAVRALITAADAAPERRAVRWSVDIDPQDTY